MKTRYCTKCGREVAEGKRFCGNCGQPMPAVPVPAETRPAAQVCVQCGAELIAGKRFCKQCGQAAGEPAAHAEPEAATYAEPVAVPATAVKPEDVTASVQGDLPAHATAPAPAAMPDTGSLPRAKQEDTWTAPWEANEEQQPAFQETSPSIAAGVPQPKAKGASKAIFGIAIGIAAALLLAAVGTWAWYVHAHRKALSAATIASQQTTAAAAQPQKPTPGTPKSPGSSTQPAQPTPPPAHAKVTSPPAPPRNALAQPVGIAPEPKPTSVARTPTPQFAPMPPRSGILHYQGPLVAYNGAVVYNNLPKGRLKFNYDHQAWNLTIKINPDGTKRVTLTSRMQGYQAKCDLGWELVE